MTKYCAFCDNYAVYHVRAWADDPQRIGADICNYHKHLYERIKILNSDSVTEIPGALAWESIIGALREYAEYGESVMEFNNMFVDGTAEQRLVSVGFVVESIPDGVRITHNENALRRECAACGLLYTGFRTRAEDVA